MTPIEKMAKDYLTETNTQIYENPPIECMVVNQDIHIAELAVHNENIVHKIDLVEFLAWIYSKVTL